MNELIEALASNDILAFKKIFAESMKTEIENTLKEEKSKIVASISEGKKHDVENEHADEEDDEEEDEKSNKKGE